MEEARAEVRRSSTVTAIEEDRHWWFASRTRALFNMLDPFLKGKGHRVLDVGSGAGNMFHHLGRYGAVVGIENNPKPIQVARRRGYDVWEGRAEHMPFADGSFDLVAALDVIEHCEDDMAILGECHRVCAPGGYIVITTPAFQWLWSRNDEINHHYRRYSGRELREKLSKVGFDVCRLAYNNTFVFPLAAVLILSRRKRGDEPKLAAPDTDEEAYQVEMEPASLPVNAVLTAVGWVEATLLRFVDLPVGTSIICIARRD